MTIKQYKLDKDRIRFTADTHFFHSNIINHCPETRGHFANVEQMNEQLIDNWNSKVPRNGIVFHLGDVAVGSFKTEQLSNLLARLNGEIHLVAGNHDDRILETPDLHRMFTSINQTATLVVADRSIVLSHFAFRTWNKQRYGAYHLYGHSHGLLPGYLRSMDVGIDARAKGKLDSWTFEEIDNILGSIDHNPNQI